MTRWLLVLWLLHPVTGERVELTPQLFHDRDRCMATFRLVEQQAMEKGMNTIGGCRMVRQEQT